MEGVNRGKEISKSGHERTGLENNRERQKEIRTMRKKRRRSSEYGGNDDKERKKK